jgi:hypothetical protein
MALHLPAGSEERKQNSATHHVSARSRKHIFSKRIFNERTGTLFTSLECPTDMVLLVIFWRLR